MSKRFIRKDVLEKVRTLPAFDYLRNYAPDLLVKKRENRLLSSRS